MTGAVVSAWCHTGGSAEVRAVLGTVHMTSNATPAGEVAMARRTRTVIPVPVGPSTVKAMLSSSRSAQAHIADAAAATATRPTVRRAGFRVKVDGASPGRSNGLGESPMTMPATIERAMNTGCTANQDRVSIMADSLQHSVQSGSRGRVGDDEQVQ